MAKSRAAALKALELDPDLPEAHVALALVKIFSEWDWVGAEEEFQRALVLNPGSAWTRFVYGFHLSLLGRLDEAIAALEGAQQIDPLAVNNWNPDLGAIHELRGEHELAVTYWRYAAELNPNAHGPKNQLGTSLCREGEVEEGIALLEQARSLSPDDPFMVADLAYCYAISGQPDEARGLLASIEAQAAEEYVDPISFALVYVGLGENDEALASFDRAVELRAHALPAATIDPRFDPLRSDPRFVSLLRRIGLAVG